MPKKYDVDITAKIADYGNQQPSDNVSISGKTKALLSFFMSMIYQLGIQNGYTKEQLKEIFCKSVDCFE